MTGLTAAIRQMGNVEVLDTSTPRPNRYDTGVRVYLTVRITGGEASA